VNKKALTILHVGYWLGAVIDVAAGLIMVVPFLYGTFNRIPGFTPSLAFTNVAWMGAPLMFGWTVLLLWADRKPVERSAVLLITLIPILGNAFDQVLSYTAGFYPLSVAVQQWCTQSLLVAIIVVSYGQAVKIKRAEKDAGKTA